MSEKKRMVKMLNVDKSGTYLMDKSCFDEAYNGCYEKSFAIVNLETLYNHILRYKKCGDLLDIGCAHGSLLKKAEKHFKTYGIDISEYAFNKAKKISPNSVLFKGNIEKGINVFGKKFDVVIAHDVLEHLKNPEKVIKESYNILKEDGYFFIRIPNKSCLTLKVYKLFGIEHKWKGYHKTHITVLELKEWKKMLELVGFECRIVANPPTLFLRKILLNYPSRELPNFFSIFNQFTVIVCHKKRKSEQEGMSKRKKEV